MIPRLGQLIYRHKHHIIGAATASISLGGCLILGPLVDEQIKTSDALPVFGVTLTGYYVGSTVTNTFGTSFTAWRQYSQNKTNSVRKIFYGVATRQGFALGAFAGVGLHFLSCVGLLFGYALSGNGVDESTAQIARAHLTVGFFGLLLGGAAVGGLSANLLARIIASRFLWG